MTNRRLQNLYQRDFQAWKSDVLGFRTYEKMREIGDTALFGEKNRTAIKSSNGVAKSFEISAMIGWVASVFDLGEAVSIVSAPTIPQIEKVIWTYLKANHGRAASRGTPMPGWLNESLAWKAVGPAGNIDLAFGRKPSEQDAVSTFQGTRSQFGKTYVFFDEAGGMSRQMFTAVEAIITGEDARFVAIGNPDNAGTEWQRIFTDPKLMAEYNLFTVSAFDLPWSTGEIVYPDDPEMEARLNKSLTTEKWVEHKKRVWGETDARYLSKVLGQFPKDAGNGFFGQGAINMAMDTDIPDDPSAPSVIGVDIARWGQDESVIAVNRNGRIRVGDSWGKCDLVDSARRIHKFAFENHVSEVRIDSTGVGGGVYDILDRMPEFMDKNYVLIGWDNGSGSPDMSQWANKRAYAHDSLRTQMVDGSVDLDYDDEELRNQLQIITYKFNPRGAIQITPKDDMKTEMGGSPDRLDAVIMSAVDMSPWMDNPYNRFNKGDRVVMETPEITMDAYYSARIEF